MRPILRGIARLLSFPSTPTPAWRELITQDIIELDLEDNLPSDEQTLLARIPLMAGSPKKAAYLAYRSVGFTITKSCQLAGTTMASVHQWRKSDPVFREWEQERLQELQSRVGNDIIKFDILRNMKLFLNADFELICKAMVKGVDSLTPREFTLYKEARKFYTPEQLLTIEKVIAPEKHRDATKLVVNLNWGNMPDSLVVDGEAHELEERTEVSADNLLGL